MLLGLMSVLNLFNLLYLSFGLIKTNIKDKKDPFNYTETIYKLILEIIIFDKKDFILEKKNYFFCLLRNYH